MCSYPQLIWHHIYENIPLFQYPASMNSNIYKNDDLGNCRRKVKPWLVAWTGNKPEKLIEFYSEDAFYLDPAKPSGLKGPEQIFPYFKKLLEANPRWIWEAVELFPAKKGFTAKWKATIRVGTKVIIEYGMDIVEIENGKIKRNEVYFDKSNLLASLMNK